MEEAFKGGARMNYTSRTSPRMTRAIQIQNLKMDRMLALQLEFLIYMDPKGYDVEKKRITHFYFYCIDAVGAARKDHKKPHDKRTALQSAKPQNYQP